MPRIKEKQKIIHEPSTHELFLCLGEMPSYSKILLENNSDKPYSKFLQWLLEINFYKNVEEKITIKRIATDFKTETTKATKWIKEIYEAILDLNWEKPELFQADGVKLCLYMKHYDNHCHFNISLPVLPRVFETFKFYFAKAKVGIDYFWVNKVEHEIEEDNVRITVWLEGGFLNKYREFALDKALFQGWLGFMDVYHKHSFELDDELRKIYKT